MRPIIISIGLLAISSVTALHPPMSIHKRDSTLEGFIKADPGGSEEVDATAANLLVGSRSDNKTHVLAGRASKSRPLLVRLVNKFKHQSAKAYISGLDPTGNVFFVGPGGKLVYPTANGSPVPVEIIQNITIPLRPNGEPLSITLPSFIRSGRVYFSNKDLKFFVIDIGKGSSLVQPSVTNIKDPNAGVNWGFVELTYVDDLLYANISYVDFVGIVLGMTLVARDGSRQVTAGLEAGAVSKICYDLVKQSKIDGRQWSSLCVSNNDGKPIRVLSPGIYYDINPEILDRYWTAYIDDVWKRYSSQDLMINTQSKAGVIKCRIVDGKLACDGNNRKFIKPTSQDIWGCNSGPFAVSENEDPIHTAIIPRLCASFVRSTLLVDGGNIQPSLGQQSYYGVNPTNHYSRIVHLYEADGRGYAFAYDDVNPSDDEDASGVVSSNNVDMLTIHVGGPMVETKLQ